MNHRSQQTVVFTDSDSGGIIHVANIKGGVGKSTVATNLAAALAKRGPALLIDLDVQGSASVALGIDIADCPRSSWELFRNRFGLPSGAERTAGSPSERILSFGRRFESRLLPWVTGQGEVTSIATRISPCLDLVPANSSLFKTVRPYHLANFLYNLQLCRRYYEYIVLDTPSVWNDLTKALYRSSDLNLVPVTLNALSTRSLRDYLTNLRNLAQKHRNIRVRILKNEVFGKEDSKIKGKTRTMSENRKFLEKLCEDVVVQNPLGITLLPQTLLFDLEIPDSALVRDAQDEGKTVHQLHQYSVVTKAFDELAKRVQYVLNSHVDKPYVPFWERYADKAYTAAKLAAAAVLILTFGMQPSVKEMLAPRPIAPQQLREVKTRVIEHAFVDGESVYRIAKYAICRFRAVVPSPSDINRYVLESVEIHNRTRRAGEQIVSEPGRVSRGTVMNFYPPSFIENPREKQLTPVYAFFSSLVKDPFPYITGDWCERGTGGGQPHYGIDVAATLGTQILSPIDGIAVAQDFDLAGRTLGVVNEGSVIFFSHMDRRLFKTGEPVKRGQCIGTVGMTGRTYGPHVHIGYGVKSPSPEGVDFGRYRYKLTDPKLFYYREVYLGSISKG